MSSIELGKQAEYPEQYSPDCLEPIARSLSRSGLGLNASALPFTGIDVWTGYELSWLDLSGKPQVAIGYFEFDAKTDAIVESKSFKYYLNSFNQTRFESWVAVQTLMQQDLANASGGDVNVRLEPLSAVSPLETPAGQCIDDCPLEAAVYTPDAALLKVEQGEVSEQLFSHLLKSNCPVTGQPDWATVWVSYRGNKITPESLLAYVVSYRQHQDFHENCVEKIFTDIMAQCAPVELSVYARYTRRGGLDINPFRTNCGAALPGWRIVRQ